MGVHGFLMVPWRDSTALVMTPPSYTNPTLPWMLFGNWLLGSHPNSARIERRLRDLSAANFNRLAQVRAVLVGHGHYDHLMDLPYLAPYLPNATVYGSSTVVNMLAPARGFAGRLRSVDDIAGTDATIPGQSIAIGRAGRDTEKRNARRHPLHPQVGRRAQEGEEERALQRSD
jgi:glyoxylase-like metal-dependent hydrolase (beta-lactamase superfamily II)